MKYIPVFSFLLLHTGSLLGSQQQNANNLQNLSFAQMVERLRLNDAERLRALLLGYIPYRAQPVAPRVPVQPAANDDAKSAPAQQSMLASFASSKK